jgi:hypothetical protein
MQPYQQYPGPSSSRSTFRLNPAVQHEDISTNEKAGPSSAPAPPPPTTAGPRVATGDWTRDLVHLAKTAELKKHALSLQLQTAHILSAHATLDQKSKAIQDVKEQQNKCVHWGFFCTLHQRKQSTLSLSFCRNQIGKRTSQAVELLA